MRVPDEINDEPPDDDEDDYGFGPPPPIPPVIHIKNMTSKAKIDQLSQSVCQWLLKKCSSWVCVLWSVTKPSQK